LSKTDSSIFCIGRELLDGIVLDRNANFMAGQLTESGCRVRSIQVLDHEREVMVAAFRDAIAKKVRYVCTTGGLGPGHDDITRECVAESADLPLHQDDAAAEMIGRAYRRLFARGVVEHPELNEDRLRMAQVPEGSICYENPIGTAPAVQLPAGETTFFLLPGMPEEMRRLFSLHVIETVRQANPGAPRQSRIIEYPGRDESAISRVMADLSRRYPDIHGKVRTHGEAGIRITIFSDEHDTTVMIKNLELAEADLRARLGLEVGRNPVSDQAEA